MRRRDFITLVGGAAAAWPFAVRTQQPARPIIGLLGVGSRADNLHLIAAFHQGLTEVGYIEGQNVLIEYLWADNQYGRLPALAADLAHRRVTVIVAMGGAPSWMPFKATTVKVPIVLQGGGDPVKLGLVDSLSRPGGNVTGVINISAELTAKRLEVLRELVPQPTMVAVLANPNNPTSESQLTDLAIAARALHQKILIVNISSDRDLDEAFSTAVRQRGGALLVIADAMLTNHRQRLVALAERHAVPAIYSFRDFPADGGLISFGANLADEWRKTGNYAGRILKGDKPADLPVLQPTKFELVINLKTAKALGLEVPPSLLARADEVIE